jgi:hypothetical protein
MAVALALICACDMESMEEEEDGDLDGVGSLTQEVNTRDILELLDDAAPDSVVTFPPGTSSQQINAAMNQLDAKLRPKPEKPQELEADPAFESSLTAKQKRGLKKVKDGYAQKVSSGDIKPVKKGGRWEVEVKGPPSGEEPLPSAVREVDGAPEHSAHEVDSESLIRPLVIPHSRDGICSWSISWYWWGVRVKVDHECLNWVCVRASDFLSRSSLPYWIKWALSRVGCLPHSLDGANDGGSCSVTWAGIFWCSG